MAGNDCVVTSECIYEIIDFFATRGTQYRAKLQDRRYEVVEKMCLHLFARDYFVQTIDNSDGSLCANYPSRIIILERDSDERDRRKTINDAKKINELFMAARSARCFCRFPVPVILFDRKNICRSSTLSTAAEMYGRSGMEWIFSGGGHKGTGIDEEDLPWQYERRPNEWGLVDQLREYDSQLISVLGVGLICDLMVEMRKTAYGMTVTSSEKADGSQWYSRFNLASIPYPGCEFFCKYKSHSRHAESLHYDWSKSQNDATLSIPSPLPESVGIPYEDYQSWNIVKLTQNYMKLLLHYLKHEQSGLLLHCVSGWDRTPLYISLIRLSLWADGLIHTSLGPSEILYLTLAYDWFMFGHKFEERLKKSEEVLYFCFDFLKYITSEDYSIGTQPVETMETETPSYSNSHFAFENVGIKTNNTKVDESWHQVQAGEIQGNVDISFSEDVTKSLCKVSVDPCKGNCLYNPSLVRSRSPVGEDVPEYNGSPRTKRLLTVRNLFITSYKRALPQSDMQTGGGIVQELWGRLTSSRT